MQKTEIFTVNATRCLRCGGILLSEYGLKHGMGHTCKKKFDEENAPIDPDQLTLFTESEDNSDAKTYNKN